MMRFAALLLLLTLALPAAAEERGHISTGGRQAMQNQTPRDPGMFYKFVHSLSPESAIKMWRGGERPDLKTLMTLRGFAWGAPVYLRVFKQEEVIEAWVLKGERFELFEIYPICVNSGALGPKLKEGDRQAPEGFYEVSAKQLNPNSKYHLALNMGYPNQYDRDLGRTGAALMIHGACASIGCYALTDANIEEVYGMAQAALENGQDSIPVHAFPFRMTDAALARHRDSRWYRFWAEEMMPVYRDFEATHLPPRMMSCAGVYHALTGYDMSALPETCRPILPW